jgi:MYXO-CTERM domain-containing protein
MGCDRRRGRPRRCARSLLHDRQRDRLVRHVYPHRADHSVGVGKYFYGSPWNGTGVANFATDTLGQSLTSSDWLAVNYGNLGLGNANNGIITYTLSIDLVADAGADVDYRLAFSGDNRVIGVRFVTPDDVASVYSYATPLTAPAQGDSLYRGFTETVLVAPAAFTLSSAVTSVQLQVDLYNEQNFDSFGSSSPTGLIVAGEVTARSPSIAVIPEPASASLGLLTVAALALHRRRPR